LNLVKTEHFSKGLSQSGRESRFEFFFGFFYTGALNDLFEKGALSYVGGNRKRKILPRGKHPRGFNKG
jgi:hypothetical protein